MSDANYDGFQTRLRRINRSHRRLSRGYVQLIERDGMLIPVARPRARVGFPTSGLIMLIVAILVFKGFLFAALGESAYDRKLAGFADGTGFEKAGAWVMQADPITRWVGDQIAPML